jgi:hypothetical protein
MRRTPNQSGSPHHGVGGAVDSKVSIINGRSMSTVLIGTKCFHEVLNAASKVTFQIQGCKDQKILSWFIGLGL